MSPNRVEELEARVNELEDTVDGLTAELLALKDELATDPEEEGEDEPVSTTSNSEEGTTDTDEIIIG